jgi:hypothetical protein
VFDLYDEALEHYAIALVAWRQRHEARESPARKSPRNAKVPRPRH